MKIHNMIPLEAETEWKDALKGIRHSFYHTRESCYAMHLTTGYRTYLYCFEHDGVRIVCPVAERDFEGYTDIVTPYGFSGFTGNEDFSGFENYWRKFVKEKKYVCGYISLNPSLTNSNYYSGQDAFKSTNLFYIDLKLSLTELFENLDSNRKKIIKNFRKYEAGFIYDRSILTKFFTENYYDFLKRINASQANYFSKETLEYICSLENIYMVGAGTAGNPEAVYLFAHTESEGLCLFNVALPEGRQYASLLLWSGLKFFRSKKIPLMNLGGGIKEDDSVALSKERFGAYKLPFYNLKQIYDQDVYEKLCTQKGFKASDKSGYFPVYRKS
ncbi:MAG: hypothetical protein IPL16_13255 [Ignavibacteria bacterium]|nr:hypothetical protein [Ignavibacteria bacterium]